MSLLFLGTPNKPCHSMNDGLWLLGWWAGVYRLTSGHQHGCLSLRAHSVHFVPVLLDQLPCDQFSRERLTVVLELNPGSLKRPNHR